MSGEETTPSPAGLADERRLRLRVRLLAALAAVVGLAAAVAGLAWDLNRLKPYELGISEGLWLTGAPWSAPRRPIVGEAVRRLGSLPRVRRSPVQVTWLRPGVESGRAPLALLALSLSGEAQVYVNAIPVQARDPQPGDWLTSPRAAARLHLFPPAFLHPDRNRYDLLVHKPVGRVLAAPIYVGPEAVLRPAAARIAAWTAVSRPALAWLGGVAAVLALASALARRAPRPWLAIAAAAAAVGLRAWIGEPANVVALGDLWPAADWSLIAAACACLLLAAWETRGGDAAKSVEAAGAALYALAGVALLAAVWGALQVFSGLWLVRLDMAYGLGAAAALAAAAAVAAVLLGQAVAAFARTQLDLRRVVRTQREEIATKSQALEQEMRRSAILEERQRLARDMHDGIGGQLVSLIARVRSRRVDIAQVERELVGGLAELRLVVDSLDATGDTLAEALGVFRSRVQPQADAAGMSLAWSQGGDLDVKADDPRWVLNVYRLLQEAVSNAVGHSGGDRLEVVVERDGEHSLRIEVADNGRGLGKDPSKARGAGRGLSNMTYRANQLGGELEIGEGLEGRGARIGVRLPLPERRAKPAQSSGEISPS